MSSQQLRRRIACVVALALASGCASPPAPRIVYGDSISVVQLQHDVHAGDGHSHPATLSVPLIRRVLAGLRVQKRSDIVLSLITGEPETVPAFTGKEVEDLAPNIKKALSQATATEVVAFYRRVSDADLGLGVTSGGVLVNQGLLYVVLANHRSRFADVMREGISYELDPVRDPLQSLRSRGFKVSFFAERAVAHPSDAWEYIDPGKVVVLDLQTLQTHFDSVPVVGPSPSQ